MWGEGVDVAAFASLIIKNIRAVVLTLPRQGEVDTITFYPIGNDGNVITERKTQYQVKKMITMYTKSPYHLYRPKSTTDGESSVSGYTVNGTH